MKYPLTFVTDKYIGKNAAASTRACCIFIRPKYIDDVGLYQHELLHVVQWAGITLISAIILGAISLFLIPLSIGIYGALYEVVPAFRLWSETMAYNKQLQYYDDDRSEKFAGFIATRYDLTVDTGAILKKLKKQKK